MQTDTLQITVFAKGFLLFFRYTIKDNSKKHVEVWDPSPEEIISNEVNNLNSVSTKSVLHESLQSLYNKELPVHICNVVSPEKIYIQWLLTENLLNRYKIQGKHIAYGFILFSTFCFRNLEAINLEILFFKFFIINVEF